jgi:MFS family permease
LPGLVPFLIVMVLAQAVLSVCFNAPGVIAPVAAPALGLTTAALGPYVGAVGIASLAGGMFIDGVIRRYGGARTLQLAVFVSVAGVWLAASGNLALMALSSVVLGFGGGMMVPPAILLVSRVTPPERTGLVFAINQCGVPLGFGLAGVVFPLLLKFTDWRMSLVIVSLVVLSMAMFIQPMRAALDAERNPRAPLGGRALMEPMRLAWREPRLRLLGWMAFSLMTVQMSFLSYLVSYVKIGLGFSHIQAGAALFMSQVAAVVVRLIFGWLIDRLGRYWLVLGLVGLGSGLSSLGVAALVPDLPYVAIAAMAVLAGGCVMGWNALYFAAVSREAPEGRAGTAVGGTQIFTAIGGVVGPLIMAAVLDAGGSYGLGFAIVSVFSLAIGVRLLRFDLTQRAALAT